jgi:adenylylsulfate kinase
VSEGFVVWLTGLPASGKSALAERLVAALRARARPSLWLDSDDLRRVLTPDATYDPAERDRFYAALGHLAALGAAGGGAVIVSATASRRAYRDAVRARVSSFVEVHLVCGEATLRSRDPKGLYQAAAEGRVTALPGAGAAYEAPEAPELALDSERLDPAHLADAVLRYLDARGLAG